MQTDSKAVVLNVILLSEHQSKAVVKRGMIVHDRFDDSQ